MAQPDLLADHLQDTTSSAGASNKVAKMRTTVLWVVGAVAFGIIFSLAQMRQYDKVNVIAVKEGKIPAITLSVK